MQVLKDYRDHQRVLTMVILFKYLLHFFFFSYFNVNLFPDKMVINQSLIPAENGNNDVQSSSGPEVEAGALPEATILAQVAQRCSTKYINCLLIYF